MVEKPKSVWRYAKASRAHVIIDAAAYFELMRDAMLNARQRIFLISWDFDSRVRLGGGRRWWNLPRAERYPARLGAFFVWLVHRLPGLQVNCQLKRERVPFRLAAQVPCSSFFKAAAISSDVKAEGCPSCGIISLSTS